jgi:hypothetical protein
VPPEQRAARPVAEQQVPAEQRAERPVPEQQAPPEQRAARRAAEQQVPRGPRAEPPVAQRQPSAGEPGREQVQVPLRKGALPEVEGHPPEQVVWAAARLPAVGLVLAAPRSVRERRGHWPRSPRRRLQPDVPPVRTHFRH